MNYQVNANITVLIDGHSDCYSQQTVFVQWYACVRDSNGNYIVDPTKAAKIGTVASPSSTLSYTAWKALDSAGQIAAIKTFISSQY